MHIGRTQYQAVPRFLLLSTIHYHVHKILRPVLAPAHINLVNMPISCSFMIPLLLCPIYDYVSQEDTRQKCYT